MEDIRDEIVVMAPLDRVWKAIQDPGEHAEWHPFMTRIEGQHAMDSTRKCEVLVGRKHGTTEERCSTFDEPRRIMWSVVKDSSGFSRMVADWSAGFSVEPLTAGTTHVTAQSLFEPRRFFVRLAMPGIRRKFHQTQRAILHGLKQHVER